MVKQKPFRWNRPSHKKRNRIVSFRVTQEELRYLNGEAGRQKLSLSGLLRLALERLFGETPE